MYNIRGGIIRCILQYYIPTTLLLLPSVLLEKFNRFIVHNRLALCLIKLLRMDVGLEYYKNFMSGRDIVKTCLI